MPLPFFANAVFTAIAFHFRKSLPNSVINSFSCSLKFVVGLFVFDAMLQRHNHYPEICIRNNFADNAFPRKTWFIATDSRKQGSVAFQL